jgi:hypothetical protein
MNCRLFIVTPRPRSQSNYSRSPLCIAAKVGRFCLKLVIKLMIDIAFGASEEIVGACFKIHAPQSI